jgi:hypothetical protein
MVKMTEQELRDRIAKLEERLEIAHRWRSDPDNPDVLICEEIPPEERDDQIDGIEARDCTIKLCKTAIEDREKIIGKLKEALRPFAEIPFIQAGSGDLKYEAVHYWAVVGHPNKSDFTRDDLKRAKEVMGIAEPDKQEAGTFASDSCGKSGTVKTVWPVPRPDYEPVYIEIDELKKIVRTDGSICGDCAKANGAVWPNGHVATWSEGICSVCKQTVVTCAISDWDWPDVKGKKASREF